MQLENDELAEELRPHNEICPPVIEAINIKVINGDVSIEATLNC